VEGGGGRAAAPAGRAAVVRLGESFLKQELKSSRFCALSGAIRAHLAHRQLTLWFPSGIGRHSASPSIARLTWISVENSIKNLAAQSTLSEVCPQHAPCSSLFPEIFRDPTFESRPGVIARTCARGACALKFALPERSRALLVLPGIMQTTSSVPSSVEQSSASQAGRATSTNSMKVHVLRLLPGALRA
jgi:hypothetical protein